MNKLQAVNRALIAIGENPVPALDVEYPTLNRILVLFDDALYEVLEEGWWFNTQYEVDLQVDVNGQLQTPEDTLKFYPDERDYVFNGNLIVNVQTGSPVTNTVVKGRLVTLREFDALPAVAQYAIMYHCAAMAYISDHGEDSTSRKLEQHRDRRLLSMGGDHTRYRQVNSRRDNRRVQRWYRSLRA